MNKVIRYLAALLPFPQGRRAALYRLSGMRIGPQTIIDRNLQVTRPDMIEIGARVTICNAVSILGEVTAVHSRLEKAYNLKKAASVVIEDDAYIGVKATILPGVRIGRMATVGANTLVMADYRVWNRPRRAVRVMMVRPTMTIHHPEPTRRNGNPELTLIGRPLILREPTAIRVPLKL